MNGKPTCNGAGHLSHRVGQDILARRPTGLDLHPSRDSTIATPRAGTVRPRLRRPRNPTIRGTPRGHPRNPIVRGPLAVALVRKKEGRPMFKRSLRCLIPLIVLLIFSSCLAFTPLL